MEFGGNLSRNKRKSTRPLDLTKSLHLVLRSSKAFGKFRLNNTQNKYKVDAIIIKFSQKFNVKIYEFANARNHLHFLIKTKNKIDLQNFLRTITSQITLKVHGKGKFWDLIAYTKIVNWGKHFEKVVLYIIQNKLEFLKLVPYRQRI